MEAEKNSKSTNAEKPDRIDLDLLVLGKRAGLSFEEINMFRARDLLSFVDIYTGKQKSRPRKATQKDIDDFYS